MSFTGQNISVKENYMLCRKRVMAFTQVVSEELYLLPAKLFFKGKGTISKVDPSPRVHFQWAEKGFYWVENMLDTIKHLPNKDNLFTCKNFEIYFLDNYSVDSTEDIKKKLLTNEYVPIVMGGGIAGDM